MPSHANPTLLILVVNYHSGAQTQLLAGDIIANLSGVEWQLRVVDNTSPADPALNSLPTVHPNISVLRSERNLGYFGAAAWGLREYTARAPLPDWIMVANADLRLVDKWTSLPQSTANCAVIAPAIISTFNGQNQNPYLPARPTLRRMRFLRTIAASYWLAQAYFLAHVVKKKLPQRDAGRTAVPAGPIYAPHGACILFARQYFSAGGTLDYGSFLFGEELFVAETARRLHLGIRYHPDIRLRHDEHKSTGWLRNRTIWRYHRQSSDYCYRHYFAPGSQFDD